MGDIYMSLDLELCQPSNAICQIGAVVGNIKTGEILAKLSVVVDPGEVISPYIEKLTGVTNERVAKEGVSLQCAYEQLQLCHREYGCEMNPLTWGGGDTETLRNQLGLDQESWLFGRRWIDVKTVFISYCIANDLDKRSGLSKSLGRLGMKFEGRKHDAMSDAMNTFYIFRKLLTHMRKSDGPK